MQQPRSFLRWLLPFFCLFHMAGVASYLVPYGKGDLIDTIKDTTRGYVLITSQWQKWDIFSPNPIRRVSTYVVERNALDVMEPAVFLNFDTLTWWERATELKILGRLEEDRWNSLAVSYLRTYCEEDLYDTDLRLVAESYVLPPGLEKLKKMSETSIRTKKTTLAWATCNTQ